MTLTVNQIGHSYDKDIFMHGKGNWDEYKQTKLTLLMKPSLTFQNWKLIEYESLTFESQLNFHDSSRLD